MFTTTTSNQQCQEHMFLQLLEKQARECASPTSSPLLVFNIYVDYWIFLKIIKDCEHEFLKIKDRKHTPFLQRIFITKL